MSLSRKYGRTLHYPFSPGKTKDDRVNFSYWEDLSSISDLVHTEKLDGENSCLNKHGVFARSHSAPTIHPWSLYLRQKWEVIKNDLGDLEIFGENIYAIHSIEYQNIEQHFYVFGVRLLDQWLSWEEVKFYAAMLDFATVPELSIERPSQQQLYEKAVLSLVDKPSEFQSIDVQTGSDCTMEGIVSRNANGYSVGSFQQNVFKYVRKDHVKTDQHWMKNWRRAPLNWEKNVDNK